MKKIGIVGAGNMGGAFYKGLIQIFSPDDIFVCDHHQEKLEAIQAKNTSGNFQEMFLKVDVVIIAVKPQSFVELWDELEESTKKNIESKIIVSIMAGISLQKIKEITGISKIVRAMPNLPAKIQKGFTGWIATPQINSEEKTFIQKILQAVGEEIELKNESDIDAITALSGSGPAYFYFVCEAMIEKAIQLGFDQETAQKIIETTFYGSAELLNSEKIDAETLRKKVTSKGGTTEAALEKFTEKNLKHIFAEGIDAALNRAKELNA